MTKKVELPPGYCSTCAKKSLDRVDLLVEAEEKLSSLTKKMMVAFMIGDRDGALAEISYQLGITPGELSVAGPWESPKLTREMARAIVDTILNEFPDVLEDILDRSGIYHKMRERERRKEAENERWRREMDRMTMNDMRRSYDDYGFGKFAEPITPRHKEYYIPPWTSKKNER